MWVAIRNKTTGQVQEMVPRAAHALVAGGMWDYVAASAPIETAVVETKTENALSTAAQETATNVPFMERAVRWARPLFEMGPRHLAG